MILREVLLYAVKRGYYVDSAGAVFGPRGRRKLNINSKGYPYFSVKHPNRGVRSVEVHRLVAYQKFGVAIFDPILQVRHLDGDPTNNEEGNIDIGTSSDNQMDKLPEVRKEVSLTAARRKRRITFEEAEALRKDRRDGMVYSQLARKYGVQKSCAFRIVKNQLYRCK
jgi:hypothetical protein